MIARMFADIVVVFAVYALWILLLYYVIDTVFYATCFGKKSDMAMAALVWNVLSILFVSILLISVLFIFVLFGQKFS